MKIILRDPIGLMHDILQDNYVGTHTICYSMHSFCTLEYSYMI